MVPVDAYSTVVLVFISPRVMFPCASRSPTPRTYDRVHTAGISATHRSGYFFKIQHSCPQSLLFIFENLQPIDGIGGGGAIFAISSPAPANSNILLGCIDHGRDRQATRVKKVLKNLERSVSRNFLVHLSPPSSCSELHFAAVRSTCVLSRGSSIPK